MKKAALYGTANVFPMWFISYQVVYEGYNKKN